MDSNINENIAHNLLLDNTCNNCIRQYECNKKENGTCPDWILIDASTFIKNELFKNNDVVKIFGIPKEWLNINEY